MIRYHISLIFLVIAGCLLQQFLPAITSLYDARIHLFALTFLCCSVTVGFSPMLFLAFLCGFIWDAQNALGVFGGDPTVYTDPVEQIRFGYSIILFGIMGVIMQGVQPLFRRGVWQLSAILTGFALFFYLLVEYLIINIIRGEFEFPRHVFMQIFYSSWLTMICSPILFFILFKLAHWSHYTIRYEGLKNSKLKLPELDKT